MLEWKSVPFAYFFCVIITFNECGILNKLKSDPDSRDILQRSYFGSPTEQKPQRHAHTRYPYPRHLPHLLCPHTILEPIIISFQAHPSEFVLPRTHPDTSAGTMPWPRQIFTFLLILVFAKEQRLCVCMCVCECDWGVGGRITLPLIMTKISAQLPFT